MAKSSEVRGVASDTANADMCEVSIVHLDAVQRVQEVLPNEQIMQRVAATFQILADPVRAAIVYALAHVELCVCDVAVVTGLSMSAASHQLKRLRDQDVVGYRKEGRLVYYFLRDAHIRQLVEGGIAHARENQS